MVTLPASVLSRYDRVSRYNSPYPAHDRGCAVDLYPASDEGISPVAGEVVDVTTVRAPRKPYAVEHDHLVLIDTGDHVARVLHVDPAVEPGDEVAVGDPLGSTVRSGFFAPWVDDHLHLGFRPRDRNPYRAAGSLPVELDVPVEPLAWDGTGTVVETGETYAVLDAPAHPSPGDGFVGVASDEGVALDGGLPHYDGGGTFGRAEGPVSLLGTRVGVADADGAVCWDDVTVAANGRELTGLSLFAARDAAFGAKLIHRDGDFAVGDRVEVTVRRDDAA